MNESTIIRVNTDHLVAGKYVPIRYAYMAARATIFDQELVDWANAREAWLRRKRAS